MRTWLGLALVLLVACASDDNSGVSSGTQSSSTQGSSTQGSSTQGAAVGGSGGLDSGGAGGVAAGGNGGVAGPGGAGPGGAGPGGAGPGGAGPGGSGGLGGMGGMGGSQQSCFEADLGAASGDAVASGSNLNRGDTYPSTPNCGAMGSSGEDVAFRWTPFAIGCFAIDTSDSDYDTVLRIYDSCAGVELACNDNQGMLSTSLIRLEAVAGMTVVIIIDGVDGAAAGNYVLDINYLGMACP